MSGGGESLRREGKQSIHSSECFDRIGSSDHISV